MFNRLVVLSVTILASSHATALHAQSGGFMDSATSAGLRPAMSAGEAQTFLPARGAFTFPSPYNSQGFRLTNGGDCGGQDCVQPVGYSYWNNINNHAGSETMLVFLGLERRKGGGGPTLFSVNKRTGETKNLGAMFPSDNDLSWSTAEGWYFSRTRPHALYMSSGPRMLRYDVMSKQLETVFDVSTQYGNKYVWQMHSSNDDRVHSATLRDGSSYAMLGCVVYREDSRRWSFFEAKGDFDECQVDKSGRWLVIKENLDGRNGEDNRIIDLETGVERVLYDHNGAAGHSDIGYGYLVAEDNFNAQPGAVRVWRFDLDVTGGEPTATVAGQGNLVYQLQSWSSGIGHIAHGNSRAGLRLDQQMACASNASRQSLPRVNEIVCYRLDTSMRALVVAPNLTDLNASGGGSDDYWKFPKGNLDVTGEYFIWTANAGTSRNDAYIVHIPTGQLLGGGSSTAPPAPAPTPAPSPTPEPSPTPTPTPAPTPSGMEAVRWTNLVNVSASGNTIQKTSGCGGCADAGATSEQRISSNGGVQFTATDTNSLRFVGLSFGYGGQQPYAMQFALRLQGGVAEVRESGAYRSDVRFSSSDVLRVAVDGGVVKYSKNGSVFYTSSSAPQFPLFVDSSIYDINGSISSAMIDAGGTTTQPPATSSPAPTPSGTSSAPVRWANLVNVDASGSSLRKSGGCGGCADAGAVSEQRIQSGNGSLTFTAAETQTLRFVGLGWASAGTAAGEIAFAIRLQGGVAEVRESGAYKREVSFNSGDVFEIRVDGGVVSYMKNGAVFHTSGTAPQYPLFADSSLFDLGATITDAVITGGS